MSTVASNQAMSDGLESARFCFMALYGIVWLHRLDIPSLEWYIRKGIKILRTDFVLSALPCCCWAFVISYICNDWEGRLHCINLVHLALCILLAEGSSRQEGTQLAVSAMNSGERETWTRCIIIRNINSIYYMLRKYKPGLPRLRQGWNLTVWSWSK